MAIPWETYRWFDLRVPWETLVRFVFFPWEKSNPLGDVDVSHGGTTSPKENHTSPKVNFPWETYQTLSRFYKEKIKNKKGLNWSKDSFTDTARERWTLAPIWPSRVGQ